jgi:hypothetical protein
MQEKDCCKGIKEWKGTQMGMRLDKRKIKRRIGN